MKIDVHITWGKKYIEREIKKERENIAQFIEFAFKSSPRVVNSLLGEIRSGTYMEILDVVKKKEGRS